MKDDESLDLNGHNVSGYSGDCIVFSKNEEFISISALLSKKDLILKLGIQSSQITRKFKDAILDEARKKGRWTPSFVE